MFLSTFARKVVAGKLPLSFVVASLVLAACGSGAAAAASASSSSSSTSNGLSATNKAYVIHAVVSETGQLSFLGSRSAKMLQAVQRSVNASGGIDGHSVVFDVKDNESSGQTAVSLVAPWLSEKVPFIINGNYAGSDKPVDALSGPTGPVIWDLSPVDTAPPNSNIFISGISYKLDIEACLNMMLSKGITRFALLNTTDASGVSSYPIVQSLLKQPKYHALQLVSHETYAPTDVSVTTQMSVIKTSNPQAILVWTTGDPFGTALQAQHQLGLAALPDFTSAGNAVEAEMHHFSNVLPSHVYFPVAPLYLPPSSLPSGLRPVVATFQSLVAKAGGHPNDGWGLVYESTLVLISALKHLGLNATSAQLKDYLHPLLLWFLE